MWNLVMGALVSTEDELEPETQITDNIKFEKQDLPRISKDPHSRSYSTMKELESTHQGRSSSLTPTKSSPADLAGQDRRQIRRSIEGKDDDERVGKVDADPDAEIHVVERQQGDGMEGPTPPKPQAEVLGLLPGGISDVLPESGVRLSKLPPITDKVDLAPKVTPTTSLVQEKPRVYPKGTYPPSVKKAKEAKFVPYEPYKGAVTPFVTRKLSRKESAKKLNISIEVGDAEGKVCADASPVKEDGSPETEINPHLEENYRIMLDAKEKEILQLKAALQNSEKQLKIQTQVNSEVKKLLVASVGEDIEARVDFLTQDKARLAADVIHYNNKISRDWEEKEALHVESDIWRSKFLASSVILEEVTKGKASSEARCQQMEHAARRVLTERSELASTLNTVEAIIRKLNTSFDPLSPSKAPTSGAAVLDQARYLHQACKGLCQRLIGDTSVEIDSGKYDRQLSEAEEELRQLLAAGNREQSSVPDQASSTLTRGARSLLLKLGDQAQSPGKSAFSTCSHCNGSVQVV